VPKFAVRLHVIGPFRRGDDSGVVDGAHTHRFVIADNDIGARNVAVESLHTEAEFQAFLGEPLGSDIRVEVLDVRTELWREGLLVTPGYVFYRETEDS
jgi:hypothetical protein